MSLYLLRAGPSQAGSSSSTSSPRSPTRPGPTSSPLLLEIDNDGLTFYTVSLNQLSQIDQQLLRDSLPLDPRRHPQIHMRRRQLTVRQSTLISSPSLSPTSSRSSTNLVNVEPNILLEPISNQFLVLIGGTIRDGMTTINKVSGVRPGGQTGAEGGTHFRPCPCPCRSGLVGRLWWR